MRSFLRGRHFAALLLLGALAATACGDGPEAEAQSVPQVESGEIRLPAQILGLEVRPEDVEERLGEAARPYISSIGLFSLREEDLVRATFQASAFNRFADPDDANFRRRIITLIGTVEPRELRMADVAVFVTSGKEQQIYVWFKEGGFYVLTIHQAYEFPRTLLRQMVEMDLGI